MRALSFIIVSTLIGCGQAAPYSQSETRHFRNDGNVQIDTDEVVVSAGDQAVLVGSWNFVQFDDESLDLNGFEFYALERSGDRWGRSPDYDVDKVKPECHDVTTTDHECFVFPRPIRTSVQKAFDLCWLSFDGEREGEGFMFSTYGVGTINHYIFRDAELAKVVNIDLVCDIGSEAPATTLSVELREVKGSSRDPETRFRRAEYYTGLDPDAVRAVITIE
ncbi:MAG: hypothetical protein ABIA47_02895 [bacterium]